MVGFYGMLIAYFKIEMFIMRRSQMVVSSFFCYFSMSVFVHPTLFVHHNFRIWIQEKFEARSLLVIFLVQMGF